MLAVSIQHARARKHTYTHPNTHDIHTYIHTRARAHTHNQATPTSVPRLNEEAVQQRATQTPNTSKQTSQPAKQRRTTVVLGRKMGRIYELLFMDVMCLILTQYSNKLLLLVRAFRGAAKITSTKLSFYRVHDTAGAVKVITMV